MISRIHEELGKPVMADVDTIEAAIAAEAAGADLIATTTLRLHRPKLNIFLLTTSSAAGTTAKQSSLFEGGISSPQLARP